MVIGNGLLAKTFKEFENNKDILFFCSGVSNSKCVEKSEFQREESLVKSTIKDNAEITFVYFSTCSIEDPSLLESMYVQHKLKMEGIISKSCNKFFLFRLSNAVGKSSNPNTVLNFFVNCIKGKNKFDLWENSNRNLIDVEDILKIVKQILALEEYQNSVVNVANENSYKSQYIVDTIEEYLGMKGSYLLKSKGYPIEIPTDKTRKIIDYLGIKFDDRYLIRLLEKYYNK